jgi:hypothetical protein
MTSASRFSAKRVAEVAVLTAMAAGIFGMTAPGAAQAAGTSPSKNNCYTQWFNTAWSQKCPSPGSAFAGKYESSVNCSAQGRRYLPVGRVQFSTATKSGEDCAFSVSDGKITYSIG